MHKAQYRRALNKVDGYGWKLGIFYPKNPDMDGYGSGRTGWSEVGLRILPVKDSTRDGFRRHWSHWSSSSVVLRTLGDIIFVKQSHDIFNGHCLNLRIRFLRRSIKAATFRLTLKFALKIFNVELR